MKKIIIIFSGILIIIGIFNLNNNKVIAQNNNEEIIHNISEKLIRFHVLANSNNDADQKLKMRVKDEVISYISPKLKSVQTLDEARNILIENNKEIIKLATEFIKKNGYNYEVTTTLGRENFPDKIYGNVVLPQGEYEAFRILIGEAKGENWWCVMFPPLCFVDVTKGQISYNETDEKMKEVLNEEEYKLVTKQREEKKSKREVKGQVTYKLKIFDLFNNKN